MRRAIAAAVLVALAGLPCPSGALAQGEDAAALRGGTVRISFSPDWSRWNTRFGENTPGFARGAAEPLGVDFSSSSLGTAQLPFLASEESRLRALTGLTGFALSLGRAQLTLNASVKYLPVSLEVALGSRLVVGVMVPIVRSRMDAFLLGPSDTASSSTRGNVGFNPSVATPGVYGTFRTEVDAALLALQTQAASGPASLRAQAQSTLDAIRPTLCGLYSLGAGSPSGSTSVCFEPTAPQAATLLPVTGTLAADSIGTRLERMRTSYDQTRAAFATQGVTLPTFTALFALPSASLDSLGIRTLFSDPGRAVAGDSLTTVVRTRLGDMEVGARYQLADRPRFRSQLAMLARLPTGFVDSPDNAIDLSTGDRQLDLEFGLRNDIVLSRELWVHAGARYGHQFPHELDRRVSPVNVVVAPLASRTQVRREPGDYVAVDLVPNWQLDDAFAVGVGYHYYRQGATRHSYLDPAEEARIGLPASVLDDETAISRMRVGAGVTFSTLSRYTAGRARLPYTVTASYQKTFWGEGGRVPVTSAFNLQFRAYLNLR